MVIRKCFYLVIFALILSVSCDPVFSVYIVNNTEEEALITISATNHFHIYSDEEFAIETHDNEDKQFKLSPGQKLQCGQTIGGIANELPFTEITISFENGNGRQYSEKGILEIFKKTEPRFTFNIKQL